MRGSVRTLTSAFAIAAIGGVTLGGGGAQAAKFKVLQSFCGGPHRPCGGGSLPVPALVMDATGNLYGTTASGGTSSDDGTVFEMERKANSKFNFKPLYRFCRHSCEDGAQPFGSLIVDTQGNLYGTTSRGGDGNNGVVFELSPKAGKRTWVEKVLYTFCAASGCSAGSGPAGGLTYAGASGGTLYDGVSPLYGVTAGGGANNGGTVFQLTNSSGSWSESVLYDFCSQGGSDCTDGSLPISGLLLDGSGNLFGTTLEGGGKQQAGVAFELSSSGDTWDYTVIYTFCSLANCADGDGPHGPLTLDDAGNLLGTTGGGGASCRRAKTGCGTIFQLSPVGDTWQESVIHSLCQQRDCKDGAGPVGGVTVDGSGNLYGATAVGGGNDIDQHGAGGGTIFELTASSFAILHKFCALANCADGELPQAGVILDQAGDLYGTTEYGGANGNDFFGGTVFRVAP